MSFFCCWVGFFPYQQGLPQTVGVGKGAGWSIHGGGTKQDERRGNISGKLEDTGGRGIIQGDNSTGNCFVLRDLIPMNFFK